MSSKKTEVQTEMKKAKLKYKKIIKKINSEITFSALDKNIKQQLKQKKIE